MTNSCAYGVTCWLTALAFFLAWWLLASALLWLTWNRVIGGVAKVKQAKFWQALVLVATLCVFAVPRLYMMKQCGKGHCRSHCSQSHCEHGPGEDGKKGDCPYSHQEKSKE
jgi:hypothetical protein